MPEVLSYNPSAREGEYAPVTPTQQRQIIFKPNVENGSCRSISLPSHSRTGECTSDPGVFTVILIISPYWWLSHNKHSLSRYLYTHEKTYSSDEKAYSSDILAYSSNAKAFSSDELASSSPTRLGPVSKRDLFLLLSERAMFLWGTFTKEKGNLRAI